MWYYNIRIFKCGSLPYYFLNAKLKFIHFNKDHQQTYLNTVVFLGVLTFFEDGITFSTFVFHHR